MSMLRTAPFPMHTPAHRMGLHGLGLWGLGQSGNATVTSSLIFMNYAQFGVNGLSEAANTPGTPGLYTNFVVPGGGWMVAMNVTIQNPDGSVSSGAGLTITLVQTDAAGNVTTTNMGTSWSPYSALPGQPPSSFGTTGTWPANAVSGTWRHDWYANGYWVGGYLFTMQPAGTPQPAQSAITPVVTLPTSTSTTSVSTGTDPTTGAPTVTLTDTATGATLTYNTWGGAAFEASNATLPASTIANTIANPPAPVTGLTASVAPGTTATATPTAAAAPSTAAAATPASAATSAATTAAASTSWFTESSIDGIPNWALVAGGAVLLILLMGGRR